MPHPLLLISLLSAFLCAFVSSFSNEVIISPTCTTTSCQATQGTEYCVTTSGGGTGVVTTARRFTARLAVVSSYTGVCTACNCPGNATYCIDRFTFGEGDFDCACTDVNATSLAVVGYSISPAFSSATTLYSVTVPYGTASASIQVALNCSMSRPSLGATALNSSSGLLTGSLNAGPSINFLDIASTSVTFYGNNSRMTYRVAVTVSAPSTNNDLTSLSLSGGCTLSPAFSSAVTSYTCTVPATTASTGVTPVSTSGVQTVQGVSTANSAVANVSLNAGVSVTISVVVTAQSGATKTYQVAVTRPALSTVNTLSNLAFSAAGTLSPAFSSSATAFTYKTALSTTTSTTITATLSDLTASMTIGGSPATSAVATTSVPLGAAGVAVSQTIVVTSQSGAQRTITISLYRLSNIAQLSNLSPAMVGTPSGSLAYAPAFASTTTVYTATVPYGVTQLTFMPFGSSLLTSVDLVSPALPLALSTTSAPVSLSIADGVTPNAFDILVKAEDPNVVATYHLSVIRLKDTVADLTALSCTFTLTPSFSSSVTSYTATVGAFTGQSCTPTKYSTAAYVSGDADGAARTVSSSPHTITVAPQNSGPAKTYTITITTGSSDQLASLVFSTGTGLSPAFSGTVTSYSLSIPFSAANLYLTATPVDSGANLKADGSAIVGGVQSFDIGAITGMHTVEVTSGSTRTYTVTVTKMAVSSVNTLNSITLSAPGTLAPAFDPAVTTYTYGIATSAVTSTTVTPTLSYPWASMTVNAVATPWGATSSPINLPMGTVVPITVVVTPESGGLNTVYTINARVPWNVATLQSLAPSAGALSPTFASTTLSYTVSVPYSAVTIALTAVPTAPVVGQLRLDPGGTLLTSGSPSPALSLSVGLNTFSVGCTSEEWLTSRTYVVVVDRAADSNADLASLVPKMDGVDLALTPAFSSAVTVYTLSDFRTSIKVRATAAAPLTIQGMTVNGAAVASGADSSTIALAVGVPVNLLVQVTSQLGTTKVYSVTVTRTAGDPTDATLSGITASVGTLSPSFSSVVGAYALVVPYAQTSVNVAGACSSAVASLTYQLLPSASENVAACGLNIGVSSLPYPGSQVLNLRVTSQDLSSTVLYAVTISRAPPDSVTTLSSLSLSLPGALTPSFNPAITAYTRVVNSTGSVTSVTAVPTSALATLKIQGVAVTSGTASSFLNLAFGSNVITIEVTAESQAAANYTVTLYRRSSNALLSSAVLSGVTGLLPAFSSGVLAYDGGQLNGTSTLTITAVPAHPLATMRYLPGLVSLAAGSPSAPLTLSPSGARQSLSIIVYAEDPNFALRYDFNVTAFYLPSAESALASLAGGALALVPPFAPNVTAYTLAGPAWPLAPLASLSFAPAVPVHAAATVIMPPSTTAGPGVTTFTIVCVAENGVQKTTYTVEFTNQGPPPAMAAPTASLIGPRSLTLTWAPATSLAGVPVQNYTVLRNGTAVATVPGSTSTYLDTGLSPFTLYAYAVIANTPMGSSPSGGDSAAFLLLARTAGEILLAPSPAGGSRVTWTLAPAPDPGVVVTLTFACPAGVCVSTPTVVNATAGPTATGVLQLSWSSSSSGAASAAATAASLTATASPAGLYAPAALTVSAPATTSPTSSTAPTPTATTAPVPVAVPITLVACQPALPATIVFPGDQVPVCADVSAGAPGFTSATVLMLLGVPCQQTLVDSPTRARCAAPIAGAAVTGNEVSLVALNPVASNTVKLPMVIFRDAEFTVSLLKTALSEDDKAAEPAFAVSFSPAVSAAVRVTLDFEDAALGAREVSLSPLEQTIAAGSAAPVVFSARGLPDRLRDGTTQVSVLVRALNRASRVVLSNKDTAPIVLKLEPSVTPLGGRAATITGLHVDDVVAVFAGAKPCNISAVTRSAASHRAALQLQDTEVALAVQLPRQAEVGYYNVTLKNANSSTVGVVSLVLYYTDKCPEPGLWYRNGECLPCPEGATCPGGDRLWPKPGYWNPSETSGFVQACPEASSCTGCQGHDCYLPTSAAPCAQGYEGFLCSQCATGYDKLNGACMRCPPKTFSLSLIVTDVMLWVGIALSASMIEREHALTAVTNFVIAVQEIASMGQMLSSTLPVPLLRAFRFLSIFSGDVQFFNVACDGHVPFVRQFLIRLFYMLGLMVPMLLCCLLAYLFSLCKSGVDKAERRAHYLKRAKRCVIIHSVVIFFPIAVLSLEAVSCLPMADGKARLAKFPWIVCLSKDHVGPLALSSLLLCLYALVYPAVYYFNVRSSRAFDPEVWDFSTEPYLPKFRHLWLLERFVSLALAVALGVFVTKPEGQLGTLLAGYLTMLLAIILVRPLKSMFDNLLTGLFCAVQVCTVVINFLTRFAKDTGKDLTSVHLGAYVVASLALILLLCFLGVAVYAVIWSSARPSAEDVKKKGSGGDKRRGEDELDSAEAVAEVDVPDINVITSAGTFTAAPTASSAAAGGMFAWFSSAADPAAAESSSSGGGGTATAAAVAGGHTPQAVLAAGPSALSAPADLRVYVTPVFAPRPPPAGKSLLEAFTDLFVGGSSGDSGVPALPPWWHGDAETAALTPLGADMVDCVQKLVDRTTVSEYIGQGSDNRSLTHKRLVVQSVEVIQAPRVWKAFASSVQTAKTEIESLNRSLPGVPVATDPDPQFAQALPLPQALADVNAKWLWHGTDVPDAVCVGGFDDRVNVKGLFGRHGIYFSENASKSDEYCTPREDGTCVLLLGLAIVGVPYVALTPLPKLCRPPCFLGHDTTACGCIRFDSVLGEIEKNYPGAYLKKYREFVVYDRRVTLPVLKVVYKRV